MADRVAEAAICRTGGDLDQADFITAVRSLVIAQDLARGAKSYHGSSNQKSVA